MRAAPRRISICGPSEVGEVTGPGTHPTSRLYSVAKREVMRVPDFLSASMTRVAWERAGPKIFFFFAGPTPPRAVLFPSTPLFPPPFFFFFLGSKIGGGGGEKIL